MIGRRVQSFDEIERAGDYWRDENDLWFLLPTHTPGLDKHDHTGPGDGLHRITQPPWVFRECSDGSLEVRESIQTYDYDRQPYWLDAGHIWRDLNSPTLLLANGDNGGEAAVFKDEGNKDWKHA